MAPWLTNIYIHQFGLMDIEIWAEPFAGGAGAGLTLLEADIIDELWLNEKNPALAAFWRCVCGDADQLAEQVLRTEATMTTWQSAHEAIAADAEGDDIDDLTLGFAAFFINRTSRSGIVAPNVGPIGGRHQTGKWNIASRYNPTALADRLRLVGSLAARIRFTEGDALTWIAELDGSVGIEDEMVLFIDPPYLGQGRRLYTHGFTLADHHHLSNCLTACAARWILTYDEHPLIADILYRNNRILSYSIPHSANTHRIGREYAVFSDNITVDYSATPLADGDAHWLSDDSCETPASQSL